MLKLKKRLKVTESMLKVMKSRRDSTLHLLEKLLSKGRAVHNEFYSSQERFLELMKSIFINHSFEEIEIDSKDLPPLFNLGIEEEVLVGHKVRNFKVKFNNFPKDCYAFIDFNFEVLTDFLIKSVELANIIERINVLSSELSMLRRRINFLEKVLIPRIKEEIDFIESALEEREREEIVRLRMIKERYHKSFTFL